MRAAASAHDETQATLLKIYVLVFRQTLIIHVTEHLQDTLLSYSTFAQFCCLITSERPSLTHNHPGKNPHFHKLNKEGAKFKHDCN